MSSATHVAPTSYTYLDYKTIASRPHFGWVWPPVIRQLESRVEAGKRVLDAGCGNGALCGVLAQRYQVCGFDMSDSGVELARKECPAAQFEVASAYDELRSLFGEPFQAIVSLEVIEHLYAPRCFLERIREALAPGGLVVLSTPYHGYLKNLAIALAGKFDGHVNPLFDGGHIKFFSRKTLTSLLRECGFRVVQFQGAGRLPYLWKSMILVAEKEG